MKKVIILITAFSLFASLVGCKSDSSAASNNSPSQADYEVVGMLTLNVGYGVKVQATVENLKDSMSAIPGQKPRSRLVIRNLSTGKTIYQEECGDSALSYPGFDIGRGTGLVVTTKGGSGDGIRVYEVTQSDVRIVLAEGYRAAAITMPSDELGGDGGFLIVDSDSGTSPLIVRRYQYDDSGKKYVLTGKTSFADFIRSVKNQFARPAR
jgi:hypothetical protein